jgi:hypothetical protein
MQAEKKNSSATSEASPTAGSGIFIKEVRIRNFRCLLSVDVELDKLTVLIGQNNSGKTSFLNAFFAAVEKALDVQAERGRSANDASGIFRNQLLNLLLLLAVQELNLCLADCRFCWIGLDYLQKMYSA